MFVFVCWILIIECMMEIRFVYGSERVIITVPVHIKKMHHTKTIYKIIEKPVPMETSLLSNGFQTSGMAEGTPGMYGYRDSDGGYNHGGDAVYRQVDNGDKTDPQGARHPGHGHTVRPGHESNYGPTGTDQYKEIPYTGHPVLSHEINGIVQNPDYRTEEYRDRGHRGDYARGLVHDEDLRLRHASGGEHGHQVVRFDSHNRGPGGGGGGNAAARNLFYPTVIVNRPNKYVAVGESQQNHRGPYRVYAYRSNVGDVVGKNFGDRSRGHFGTALVHVGKLKHGHVGELWRSREIPGPVVRGPHEHRHLVGYGFQGHDNHAIRSPPSHRGVPEQNGHDDQNYHGYGGGGGGGYSDHRYPAGYTEHSGGGDHRFPAGNTGHSGGGDHSYPGHNGGGDHSYPGSTEHNGGGGGRYGDHKYPGHVVHNSGGGGVGGGRPVHEQNAAGGGGYQVQENVVDYDGQTPTEPPRPAQNAYPPVSTGHDTYGTGVRGRGDSLDGMSSVFAVSSPRVVKNVYYTLDPVVPYDDVSPKSRV